MLKAESFGSVRWSPAFSLHSDSLKAGLQQIRSCDKDIRKLAALRSEPSANSPRPFPELPQNPHRFIGGVRRQECRGRNARDDASDVVIHGPRLAPDVSRRDCQIHRECVMSAARTLADQVHNHPWPR